MQARPRHLSPELFIVIHCLVWWIMTVIAKPVLDSYGGDMVEVYAWSQHWLIGSDKHPQFLPWMAKLWFMVMPQTVASFFALSAVNLAVGLFGILAFGRAVKLTQLQIGVGLALCALAFPYLTLAGKLNMNTISLSTWPWTAWALARTIDPQNGRRNLHALLFGLLAGAAMLGKYFSIVLILPLFLFSFTARMRPVWRTPAPYIAIAAFLAATLPHLLWLLGNEQGLAYATGQGAGDDTGRVIYYIAKFLLAPLIYWPIPLALAVAFLATGPLSTRLPGLLRPRQLDLLTVATIGPWITTILFSVFGLAELSMPWAIPVGFAFTLYLARNADAAVLEKNGPRLIAAWRFLWPLMIAIGVGIAAVGAWKGDLRFYAPNEEGAAAILDTWRQTHGEPLRWVAKANDAAQVAFLAPEKIEALPALPDRLPSYYPPLADWKQQTGVVFCSLAPKGTVDADCMDKSAAWAAENGMQAERAVIPVHRSGLRFPRRIDYDLGVVYVFPAADR